MDGCFVVKVYNFLTLNGRQGWPPVLLLISPNTVLCASCPSNHTAYYQVTEMHVGIFIWLLGTH